MPPSGDINFVFTLVTKRGGRQFQTSGKGVLRCEVNGRDESEHRGKITHGHNADRQGGGAWGKNAGVFAIKRWSAQTGTELIT